MQKLYLTVGLPGSGKSTWAKAQSKIDDAIIINRDSYRSMIKGGDYVFDKKYEFLIKDSCYHFVVDSLLSGFDVIVDETNLTIKKRGEVVSYVRSMVGDPIEIIIVFFDLHSSICLENRMKDPRGYGKKKWEEIINSMGSSLEIPTRIECDVLLSVGGLQ